MEYSLSDLTSHPDWYTAMTMYSRRSGIVQFIMTFKTELDEATVVIKCEDVPEYNVKRALEVESIHSSSSEFEQFLRENTDALLALCNTYRHTWDTAYRTGLYAGMD